MAGNANNGNLSIIFKYPPESSPQAGKILEVFSLTTSKLSVIHDVLMIILLSEKVKKLIHNVFMIFTNNYLC